MGHTIKRCKEPIKEDENAPTGGQEGQGFGAADASAGAGGDWNAGTTTNGAAHNDWEVATPAEVTVSGGGGW